MQVYQNESGLQQDGDHQQGDMAFNLENQSLYVYINATTALRACSVSTHKKNYLVTYYCLGIYSWATCKFMTTDILVIKFKQGSPGERGLRGKPGANVGETHIPLIRYALIIFIG